MLPKGRGNQARRDPEAPLLDQTKGGRDPRRTDEGSALWVRNRANITLSPCPTVRHKGPRGPPSRFYDLGKNRLTRGECSVSTRRWRLFRALCGLRTTLILRGPKLTASESCRPDNDFFFYSDQYLA